MDRRSRTALLAIALGAAPATRAAAQGAGAQREFRVDLATPARAEAGVGLYWPAGPYLRLGALVAGGVRQRGDSAIGSGRLEIGGRFHLDPAAESRWAPYGAAGVALTCADGETCTPRLLVRAGVEGPIWWGRWRPAIEAGIGQGGTIGFALRQGSALRR